MTSALTRVYIVDGTNDKLFTAVLFFADGETKSINFGSRYGRQYPTHKDLKIKRAYIARHITNEDWSREGVNTAGFWAKHVLWNRETIRASIADVAQLIGVPVKMLGTPSDEAEILAHW